MAEFGMDTIADHNEDDDQSTEETSLINPPDTDYAVGVDGAVREPGVSDSITKANELLSEASLPDLDTVIAQKSTGEQNADFKRILAEFIVNEKPSDTQSLDKTFADAADWEGTPDELMQPERRRNDTDGTNDRTWVHVDFIRRRREPVSARRGNILTKPVNPQAFFVRKSTYAGSNKRRLNR